MKEARMASSILTLNVFGSKYKVYARNLNSEGALGICDKQKKNIYLHIEYPEKWPDTLLHELVHAIFNEAGLQQTISHEVEEIMAEQVARVLNDNFDFAGLFDEEIQALGNGCPLCSMR
jgi:hypothetical protein